MTAEAFPASEKVAEFIVACAGAGVPFKATAGLHHPVRAEHHLTYESGSASATMHGFLNVFLAAALLREGAGAAEAEAMLSERDADAIRFDDAGVEWRGRRLTTHALRAAREDGAPVAFGSCSVREPLDDLAAMGLL